MRSAVPVVVWRLLAGLCGIAAVLSLALAALVVAARPGRVEPPVPVWRGAEVTLPDGRLFASSVALFADVPLGEGPGEEALECSFRDGSGEEVTPFVTTLTVGQDPVVVDGRRLEPVLLVRRVGQGWTIRCDGAAMDAVSPVQVAAVSDAPAALVHTLLLPVLGAAFLGSVALGGVAVVLARGSGRRHPSGTSRVPFP